ncbi:MAG: hypothetical protein P8N61_12540 [Porticoccaceae bacterium]|nr:hypothetical protein [Porticoccaceae bacterium]
MRLPSNNNTGFTLLEVLLAGFILFMVISSMTLVYRGAILTSGKAEKSLVISASVPSIRIIITEFFRENPHTEDQAGEGTYGQLDYQWTATLTHVGQPSVLLQQDAGRDVRYYLWLVELQVSHGSASRFYSFSEISW